MPRCRSLQASLAYTTGQTCIPLLEGKGFRNAVKLIIHTLLKG